jgi:small-conductance mechanosensitive channel
LYLEVQERINLGIYEEFEKNKIEFAFPTQTLHINK